MREERLTPPPLAAILLQCGKGKPTAPLLRWVAEVLGEVHDIQALHDGAGPWLVRTRSGNAVLRSLTDRIDASGIATGAAALLVAAENGLPAPRLLAQKENATLETVAEGSTRWPQATSPELLRDAGAALARVHAIAREPRPQLPFRPRPIAVDDFARDRRQGRMPTTPLLQRADEIVRSIKRPGRTHGLPARRRLARQRHGRRRTMRRTDRLEDRGRRPTRRRSRRAPQAGRAHVRPRSATTRPRRLGTRSWPPRRRRRLLGRDSGLEHADRAVLPSGHEAARRLPPTSVKRSDLGQAPGDRWS